MSNNLTFIKTIEKINYGEICLVKRNDKLFTLKKISISKSGLTQQTINKNKEKIKILSEQKYENLLTYYDTFIEEDYFYILMEYIEEQNLNQFIKKYKDKNQLIDEKIIKDIILQLFKGLISFHNNNIIHQNLSKENIFIDKNNNIKIGDFKLSYKTYIDNEEFNHGEEFDIESGKKDDIYSLGCIIYELFTLNDYYNYVIKGNSELSINLAKYNTKWIYIIESTLFIDYYNKSFLEELYEQAKYIKTEILYIKKLGEGGFGEVNLIKKEDEYSIRLYKNLEEGGLGLVNIIKKEDEYYALKKISLKENKFNEENIEKAKERINYLSKLNNKYIIKYYDYYIENDYLYILMEYGGEMNLKKFIKNYKLKNQLIDLDIILNIIKQIVIGLKGIHHSNLIHRDLKPENILINNKNEIKICDFGISKKLNINKKYIKSNPGASIFYLAPERIKGDLYNNKVDIYALGCIIYELFTTNEYYMDKIVDGKDGTIDTDIYDQKWQNLINLLLKRKYKERPTIDEISDYLEINEILLTLQIDEPQIGKKVYFLDNTYKKDDDNIIIELHDNLKEMNELNTELFINDIKYKFNKYFIPEKTGEVIIKIKLHFLIENCSHMFDNCANIKTIDLSSLNSKNVTNMSYMFSDCIILNNIYLSSFNTSKVTNMSYLFHNCRCLKSIDLTSFDTKKVTDLNHMFNKCIDLKYLDLSSFDTSNVINMNYMFSHCWKVENINLSSFNTSKVINMECMFEKCDNLKSIDLSNFDVKNVINMEGMFIGCHDLIDIDLSSFNTKSLTNMNSMFCYCEHLKNLDLSSFNTENVIGMRLLFCRCYNLNSINLSSFDFKNVTDIECMFYCCDNLEFLDLSLFNFNNNIYNHLIFDCGPQLKQIKTDKITCDKILEVYPKYKNIIKIKN